MRTFVGSRSASNDFTLDDETTDCSWNGGPTWSLAVGQHNKAVGAQPQHWNTSGIADGMLGGGVLPTAARRLNTRGVSFFKRLKYK